MPSSEGPVKASVCTARWPHLTLLRVQTPTKLQSHAKSLLAAGEDMDEMLDSTR